jgi:HK97 family phage major capsid protein
MREYLEQRAQLIGSEPGGGFLVDGGTSSQFFDRARARSVLLSAGPLIIETDSDRVKLPKLKSSVTVVNPGEAGAITASDIAVERLEVPVRKYATHTIMSAEVVSDSDPSIRRIVQMDHELQLAAALDRDMLEGSGVSKLLGLRNQPGVTNTVLGSPNGATPTLNDIADALYRLQADNANPSAIFMHPRSWNSLKKLQDLQERYQLQPDPTADARQSLFGVPIYLSSQISITQTEGSSNDCSWIGVADMTRVVVVRRNQVTVLYDPFTRSANDQVAILSTTRWGFAVIDETAVEVIRGVRP